MTALWIFQFSFLFVPTRVAVLAAPCLMTSRKSAHSHEHVDCPFFKNTPYYYSSFSSFCRVSQASETKHWITAPTFHTFTTKRHYLHVQHATRNTQLAIRSIIHRLGDVLSSSLSCALLCVHSHYKK